MGDDSMSIYVSAPRNSGLASGHLIIKSKLVNPDTGKLYTYEDLRIGSILKVRPRLGRGTLSPPLYTFHLPASLGPSRSRASQWLQPAEWICLPVEAVLISSPSLTRPPQVPTAELIITAADQEALKAQRQAAASTAAGSCSLPAAAAPSPSGSGDGAEPPLATEAASYWDENRAAVNEEEAEAYAREVNRLQLR